MAVRNLLRNALFALVLLLLSAPALHAQSLQSVPFKLITTNSTNSTLVSGAGQNILKWVVASNPSATATVINYLKLYNKATAPTCGTDVPVMTIMLPPNSGTGAGLTAISFDDVKFTLGLGFCVTLNAADNDNTSVAAGGVINVGYVNQ